MKKKWGGKITAMETNRSRPAVIKNERGGEITAVEVSRSCLAVMKKEQRKITAVETRRSLAAVIVFWKAKFGMCFQVRRKEYLSIKSNEYWLNHKTCGI